MYMTARRVRCINGALFLLIGLAACSDAGSERPPLSVVETPPVVEVPTQYASSCGACHSVGVAGAPKTGDANAWAARLEAKGMDGLVASVRNGLNAMPPGGLCNSCSDEDHAALIVYMAAVQ